MASFACSPVNFGVVLVWEGTNAQLETQGLSEYLRWVECAVICHHPLASIIKEKYYIYTVEIVKV